MPKKIGIAATASALIFAVITSLMLSGRLDELNADLANAVHSLETPALTAVLKIVTNLGEWFIYVPIALVLLIVPKLRVNVGLPAAVTLATAAALNWILKQIFAIPRPDTHRLITETGFSFPSGHAMNGTAFIGICVLLLIRYSPNRRLKTAVSIFAVFFMLMIGFSRVYLGVHNPMDVAAGYAMGLFLCLLAYFIVSNNSSLTCDNSKRPP